MLVPTLPENVTRPTRVLPLSISNLETSRDRNDFIWSRFLEPILPDSSSTKTTSAGHSIGGGSGGDVVVGGGATAFNVKHRFALPVACSWTCLIHSAVLGFTLLTVLIKLWCLVNVTVYNRERAKIKKKIFARVNTNNFYN